MLPLTRKLKVGLSVAFLFLLLGGTLIWIESLFFNMCSKVFISEVKSPFGSYSLTQYDVGCGVFSDPSVQVFLKCHGDLFKNEEEDPILIVDSNEAVGVVWRNPTTIALSVYSTRKIIKYTSISGEFTIQLGYYE
jgi:hypothetical protein